jgi:hypothetical protein
VVPFSSPNGPRGFTFLNDARFRDLSWINAAHDLGPTAHRSICRAAKEARRSGVC